MRLTLIDLRKHYDPRKLGLGVVWDGGMEDENTYLQSASEQADVYVEEEHTHVTAMLGGHIFVRFRNQHRCIVSSPSGK